MVNKNVKICDVCEKTIAEKKCFICKKDLCNICKRYLQVKLTIEESSIKEISPKLYICQNCNLTIQQLKFEDKEFGKELTKLIKPYLMKKVMLENLDDKKEPISKTAVGKLWGTPLAISGTFSTSGLGSAFVGIAKNDAKAGEIVTVAMRS